MTPILTARAMRTLEQKAEANGITNEMLMEEAGKNIAEKTNDFVQEKNLKKKAYIFAGRGNNGGDAYVAGCYLLKQGYDTEVFQVHPLKDETLAHKQRIRYENMGGRLIDALPHKPHEGIVIDGIFGTGFKGTPDEKTQHVMRVINSMHLPIIAIDTPSGINCETGEVSKSTVCATMTITVQCPKIGFFLQDAYNYVGKLVSVGIGMGQFYDPDDIALYSIDEENVRQHLPHIHRTRHKYQAGYVVGFAGESGMTGASLLSSFSALKTGAGIVHLIHDKAQTLEFCAKPLEVVCIGYESPDSVEVIKRIKKASSCFIGPGFGTSEKQQSVLEKLWPYLLDKKVVCDADVLLWLGKRMQPLPEKVLTPHLGELRYLIDCDISQGVTQKILEQCQAFVDTYTTHLVLKGCPTFLFSYNTSMHVVMRGDPGMATAGSGDVLTGIIAALMAQGLKPDQAMRFGAYLHGLAGELAAKEETSYSLTATTIVSHIKDAYKILIEAEPRN